MEWQLVWLPKSLCMWGSERYAHDLIFSQNLHSRIDYNHNFVSDQFSSVYISWTTRATVLAWLHQLTFCCLEESKKSEISRFARIDFTSTLISPLALRWWTLQLRWKSKVLICLCYKRKCWRKMLDFVRLKFAFILRIHKNWMCYHSNNIFKNVSSEIYLEIAFWRYFFFDARLQSSMIIEIKRTKNNR